MAQRIRRKPLSQFYGSRRRSHMSESISRKMEEVESAGVWNTQPVFVF